MYRLSHRYSQLRHLPNASFARRSCTFVPAVSRPKDFKVEDFQHLNEWLSDLSESEEEDSESSDDEEVRGEEHKIQPFRTLRRCY